MAIHVYPSDALFASQTSEPVGVPSLTDAQIVQLYNWWLNRPPSNDELISERENALKYSAAGIERQIANRSGNVAASGVRGDETSGALTVAAPIIPSQVGNVATMGPSAIAPGAGPQTGPLGLSTPSAAPYAPSTYYGAAGPIQGISIFGLSLTTIAIGVAVLGAAWYLLKGRR
jgi:hypothetical protein